MKKALLFLLLVNCLLGILAAQNAQTSIPVWQGFSQYWGYNHRINRLGDWLEVSNQAGGPNVQPLHFAASGSGSDIAAVAQYYSTVNATEVDSKTGFVTFEIDGREGDQIELSEEIEILLQAPLPSSDNFEVVLRGFDLTTAGDAKADKLHAFSVKVVDLAQVASQKGFKAKIAVSLKMNCSSPECQLFNQELKYSLRVYWTAIWGRGFQSKMENIEATKSWDKKQANVDSLPQRLALVGNPHYPNMTAGIKGFSIELDDEHHFLAWETWINPATTFQNMLWMECGLNFVKHSPTMFSAFRNNYTGWPTPPAKWVVHRGAGSAKMSMDICMLMFKDAEIKRFSDSKTIRWKTRPGKQSKALPQQE